MDRISLEEQGEVDFGFILFSSFTSIEYWFSFGLILEFGLCLKYCIVFQNILSLLS